MVGAMSSSGSTGSGETLKTPHLVILGASGFLGRSMLAAGSFPMPVQAVSRKPPAGAEAGIWHAADLLVPGALDAHQNTNDVVGGRGGGAAAAGPGGGRGGGGGGAAGASAGGAR